MTFAYWCILIACLLPLFCAAYAKKRADSGLKTTTIRAIFWRTRKAQPPVPTPRSKTV